MRTFLRLLHASPIRHPYPTCFLHTYPLPFLSPSLSLLSPTAWVSSLGHSIAFARQPRSSFALYWAPIRVSNQHATVGTWISLAHSSFNLVSFPPRSVASSPVKTELCLDWSSPYALATCFVHVVAIMMTAIMIYHIRSKYTAVGK